MRQWINAPPPMPGGVARAWFAEEGRKVWCGVFELMAGGTFMLTYLQYGDRKPITEQFPTFLMAQQRAIELMDSGTLTPRPKPH